MMKGEENSINFLNRNYQDLNMQWVKLRNRLGRQESLNAMALK